MVLDQLSQHPVADFIVWFGEQADLSEAYSLKTKTQKGEFVFRKLVETATQTQKNAILILNQAQSKHSPIIVVNAITCRGGFSLVKALASLPEVKKILADPAVKMEEPVRTKGSERIAEWGIQKIKADSVWQLGFTGNGVVIGGQDTGYDWEVPALKGKYRGWNGTYAVHSYNWFDAVDSLIAPNSSPNPWGYSRLIPADDGFHGTHTMGTMVGSDGANQIGVAPAAKWIGCRNMDRGWGKPSSYTKCFNWFLAPRDSLGNNPNPALSPDVINNSWGCPPQEGCTTAGTYLLMEQAVNNLKAAGIMVVVSAGNDGPACQSVASPAAIFENSFSVGATDINDQIANFSSRGPATTNGIYRVKPNISAPGVNVRSCVPSGWGTYTNLSGTSMAGPHVAGAVALVLSAIPSMKGQVTQIEDLLEDNAAHQISTDTCGQLQGQSPNNTYGYGTINVLAAVAQALPIELINFYLKIEVKGNHLFWQTAQEANSSHFEIEKSTDAKNFIKIGELRAAGYSTSPKEYDFNDPDTMEKIIYYRLKKVDQDQSFDYSSIISARRVNLNHIQFGPNPSTGLLNLRMNTMAPEEYNFEIYNITGQLIKQFNFDLLKGYNEINLTLESLPKGTYLFEIRNSKGNIVFNKPLLLIE